MDSTGTGKMSGVEVWLKTSITTKESRETSNLQAVVADVSLVVHSLSDDGSGGGRGGVERSVSRVSDTNMSFALRSASRPRLIRTSPPLPPPRLPSTTAKSANTLDHGSREEKQQQQKKRTKRNQNETTEKIEPQQKNDAGRSSVSDTEPKHRRCFNVQQRENMTQKTKQKRLRSIVRPVSGCYSRAGNTHGDRRPYTASDTPNHHLASS